MNAIPGWLGRGGGLAASIPLVGFFRDIVEPNGLNTQQRQHLDEKCSAERAAPDLGGQRHPLQRSACFFEKLAKPGVIDIAIAHQASEISSQGFLPVGFGYHGIGPGGAGALKSLFYAPTETLAQREQNEYNGDIKNDVIRRRRMGKQPTHFLKSAAARTLSVKAVMRMSEVQARRKFRKLRWPDSGGKPICPHCDCERCYEYKTRPIFKCAACRKTFSVTSGTLFSSHKLPCRDYLAAIALFVNCVKGNPALQMSRELGISHKSAFVLAHKLREAIQGERSALVLSGEVEIDGAYYGGRVRPPNIGREGKRPSAKSGRSRKKCVLTMVQRSGATVPVIVQSETTEAALAAADKHIALGSTIFADEHGSYDVLHAKYKTFRINHRLSYSDGQACTNQAESFHSRMRRAEIGQYHRISGPYLEQYAFEIAYRSDRRRVHNGAIFHELGEMALRHPVSRRWKGYWQARA